MNKKSLLLQLIFYFLKVGTIGFGGSIALAHMMQEDLVEKKKWISQEEFLRGLTLSQLAPGPLAAQLAIYIGFVMGKIQGATCAGIAFIAPSFILVVLISILYLRFGSFPLMQSILYGIGAAVIGIIASSAYTLTKRTMKKKKLLWIIYAATFIITIWLHTTNVLVFLIAGILCIFVYSREKLQIPKQFIMIPFFGSSAFFLWNQPIMQLFIYFFIAGSIAFGGGFAIVPFLQNGVVHQFHWLTQRQFVDAVSVAMITPGPVVIAATFIGYLVGQLPGALAATIAIFLPVYLIVILFTPIFTKHASHPHVVAFIEGVTAAAMASIAGSVILLGEQSISNFETALLAIIAAVTTKFLKIPGIIIILLAAVAGIILKSKGI